MVLEYTVSPARAGTQLLTILRHEMTISASLVRQLKRAQAIYVNDIPVYTNYIVQAGDRITADLSTAEPPCDIIPENGPVDILYEDAGLLIVNKPCGVIVHPSHTRYTGTLANFVAGYLATSYGDGRCHAVNRLDRDTSGVVVFAKNSHIKTLTAAEMKKATARKEYLALAYGIMSPACGTIDLPIRRRAEGNIYRIVAPDGQRAVTHYETLKIAQFAGSDISLLRFRLETGRTHQIRVHCLATGHPLLGDVLYHTDGSQILSDSLHIGAQALHAEHLYFQNPLSGIQMHIHAPVLRTDMKKIIAQMG
jgi:23S rRNA pseudouridine1911/1915/1917 synthase